MEREQQIVAAKRVLHQLMGRYSRPHSRIHGDTAEANHNRLRALEGLCGQCVNLKLKIGYIDGKEVAAVLCRKPYLPLEIYANTLMGQEATCAGFEKVI